MLKTYFHQFSDSINIFQYNQSNFLSSTIFVCLLVWFLTFILIISIFLTVTCCGDSLFSFSSPTTSTTIGKQSENNQKKKQDKTSKQRGGDNKGEKQVYSEVNNKQRQRSHQGDIDIDNDDDDNDDHNKQLLLIEKEKQRKQKKQQQKRSLMSTQSKLISKKQQQRAVSSNVINSYNISKKKNLKIKKQLSQCRSKIGDNVPGSSVKLKSPFKKNISSSSTGGRNFGGAPKATFGLGSGFGHKDHTPAFGHLLGLDENETINEPSVSAVRSTGSGYYQVLMKQMKVKSVSQYPIRH